MNIISVKICLRLKLFASLSLKCFLMTLTLLAFTLFDYHLSQYTRYDLGEQENKRAVIVYQGLEYKDSGTSIFVTLPWVTHSDRSKLQIWVHPGNSPEGTAWSVKNGVVSKPHWTEQTTLSQASTQMLRRTWLWLRESFCPRTTKCFSVWNSSLF